MEFGEILIMIASMILMFVLGVVAMLFFGGRTALNYLKVKVSRGKRVLLFAKTKFGWRSFTARKNESTLVWKYDGVNCITNVEDGDVSRYIGVDMAFVDADKPTRAIKLADGVLYPDDFDPVVFQNILIRAYTRPNADGSSDLKKLLFVVLILSIIAVFGVILVYFKLNELAESLITTII